MRASYMLGKSWKIFLGILLSLNLSFAACSKMQGPSEESGKGVVEAPPVDPCEQPENLNNILCQWVATEANSSGSKMTLDYDSAGRPTRFTTYDGSGNKTDLTELLYNNSGLTNRTSYSQPTPLPSGNFSVIDTQTNDYNSDGTLDKIEILHKINGILDTTTTDSFDYHVPGKVFITIKYNDGGGNFKSGSFMIVTKDNGDKVKLLEAKSYDNAFNVTNVSNMSLTRNSKTGRLSDTVNTSQYCKINQCTGNNASGNNTTIDPIDPTKATLVETGHLDFDDQDRMIGFTQSTDGDQNSNPPVPPDNKPDYTMKCALGYEIQSQDNIAFKHPIMNLMDATGYFGFGFDIFTVKDLFSTFSWTTEIPGKPTPSPSVQTLKWMRVWQAIPGGQPPGGSNP
jgi:YD repeat-containing protein